MMDQAPAYPSTCDLPEALRFPWGTECIPLDGPGVIRHLLAVWPERGRVHLVMVNPETIEYAIKHPDHADFLNSGTLNLIDGIGVRWAASVLLSRKVPRIPGPDLMARILDMAATHHMKAFLLGGRPGVAERAARALESQGIHCVTGWHDGFFGPDGVQGVVQAIQAAQADILLVGMGVPQQDRFIRHVWGSVSCRYFMGVGGALDILAGDQVRAPGWFRKVGLEWLFRLLQQPSRIARQRSLMVFALRVLGWRFRGLRSRGAC